MSLLDVSDLSVSYGHVTAVRLLSISVEANEVLGVIGPNGAGKSSTLRCLAGLVRASGGSVTFDGANLARVPTERRAQLGISLSPEGRKNFGPLTVEENLRLGSYPSGRLSAQAFGKRTTTVYDLFPILFERRGQQARTLSGGEAAMLAIGKAIMSQPRLLLLDEPTLGLAPRITELLFGRIQALKEVISTLVIVEQRAEGLLDVSDRILAMRRGEAQALLTSDSVNRDNLNDLYFGRDTELEGDETSPAHGTGSQ